MIDKILSNIGSSRTGQRFFKWACKPASEKFLNNTLPQIETLLATTCYVISTAKQKNIDDDRKKMLQIQNVASGLVGIGIASSANRAIGKFGEKVIENETDTTYDEVIYCTVCKYEIERITLEKEQVHKQDFSSTK